MPIRKKVDPLDHAIAHSGKAVSLFEQAHTELAVANDKLTKVINDHDDDLIRLAEESERIFERQRAAIRQQQANDAKAAKLAEFIAA